MAERKEKETFTLSRTDYHIGIVQSEFNREFTDRQLQTAIECLDEYGVAYEVITVPGAYEIPYAVDQMARSGAFDGFVALGCLIKGETIHFEVISYSVGDALQRMSIEKGIPVGFGIITASTKEQAVARTVIGYDAVYAILQSLESTEKFRI